MMFPTLTAAAGALSRLAPILLDLALRSTIVLALAGGAALAMRRTSAAARYGVWLLAFTGLLLLPVLSGALPAWQILPRFVGASASPAVHLQIVESPAEPVAMGPLAVTHEEAPVRPVSPARQASASAGLVPIAAHVPSESPAASPASPAGEAPARATHGSDPTPLAWTFYPVVIWLIGALAIFAFFLLGYVSLYLLQRRCTPMTQGSWRDLLADLARRLKVRRQIRLLSCPRRTMPMTWGLLRAHLLVPEESSTWSTEQRSAVLLHELGHIRRHDCLTQVLAQLACGLYWFNPLVWFAWRRIQIERELACDDLVLNTGAKASSYAENLLQSASGWADVRRLPALGFASAAIAIARPSTLEERLRAILDVRRNRRGLSRKMSLSMVVLLGAVLIPLATLRAQEAPGAGPAPYVTVENPPPARPSAPASPSAARSSGGSRGRNGFGPIPSPPPAVGSPVLVSGAASGNGPTCAFDATIYDVHIAVDQIGKLDIDALTRAASTPDDFEKALASLGSAKPLYRAKQSISLSQDYINIGNQVPYITNSQVTASGQTVNSVAYRNVGAIFSLSGKSDSANSIELNMRIQVSSMAEGSTPITNTVKAPIFRNVEMSQNGAVVPNQPFVIVSADASSLDSDGKAMAYIARISLGSPQATAKPAQTGER